MNTFIRPAVPEDRGAVVALIVAMGGHENAGAGPEPLGTFAAMLAATDTRIVVAVREKRVVGVATVQARTSLLRDRREAWVAVLAVAPDVRSQGIGALLLEALDREAARLGCASLVLEASLARQRAHGFYLDAGFRDQPTARRLERSVGARDGDLPERFLAAAARAATRVAHAVAGRNGAAAVGIGADGAPTEAADAAAEVAAFAELLPLGLPIVSEEAGLVGATEIDRRAPWISLDPLDGSRNFVHGYPAFATSIGLVQDGKPLAGLVADLASGSRWEARVGGGAMRDGRPIRTRRSPLVAMPRPVRGTALLRDLPKYMRVRISGSTASDLCHVADGSVAAFFALDRPVVHVHDLAAAMVIAQEAGGCIVNRSGAVPLLVPDPAMLLDIVAACDRETALVLVNLM